MKLTTITRLAVLSVSIGMGVIVACGSDRPNSAADVDGGLGPSGEGPCMPNAVRPCYELVGVSESGTKTCFQGTQVCSTAGAWGACTASGAGGGQLVVTSAKGVTLSASYIGGDRVVTGVRPAALSTASPDAQACANPCDPNCVGFDECYDGGSVGGDGGPTTFPPSGLPACSATAPGTGNSCDCTGGGATCGVQCNSLASCEAIGRAGKTADFDCNSTTPGGCNFKCETGSTCNIDCNSSVCNIECPPGATCNISCNSSTCNLNCGAGSCNLLTCNSSTCPTTTYGSSSSTCPITPPPATNPTAIGSFPGIPGGHVAKLVSDRGGACTNGGNSYNHECGHWPHQAGSTRHTLSYSACQADTFCEHGSGCCTDFPTNGAYPAAQCSGADFTIGRACNLAGADWFPVCNRGTTTVPPNTLIGISIGPSAGTLPQTTHSGAGCGPTVDTANKSCFNGCPNPAPACDINVGAAGLAPGQCVKVNCGNIPGTKNVYVNTTQTNGTAPYPECAFQPAAAWPVAGNHQANQPGCANNWTVFNNPPPCIVTYDPITFTEAYNAGACLPGQRAVWSRLGWNSVVPATPAGARILFEVRTRSVTPAGDGGSIFGAWTAWFTAGNARNPGPDPQLCPLCKDLGAALGSPTNQNQQLELRVTLTPSTPATAAPQLNTWQVTYTCIDAE